MALHVQLFAAFAEFSGNRELEMEYQPGMRCKDIWDELRKKYPRLPAVPPLFAKNDEYIPLDAELFDKDSLMIFPPVSGG